MAKRDVAIDIISPTEGLHKELAPSMITPRSTPNALNANAYYGVVQKEYGTTLFSTATGGVSAPARCNYMYEADFPSATILEIFTHTAMLKYSAGTFASDGQVYSGTFGNFWNACMHNSEMYYVNGGVNLLQYKAAYNSTGTNEAGALSFSSLKAYAVVSFKEHLNAYHTVESGVECPKRVRWTKIGILGHTDTDWNTGVAGFLDLQNMDGSILTADKIGAGGVAIYAEKSIHLQQWVGGASVYQFDKVVSNVDIPTARCIAVNDGIHYVIMRDGVYEYTGDTTPKKISTSIDDDWQNSIHPTGISNSFIQYIRDVDEVRVYVPDISTTQPNMCFICKVKDNYSWWKDNRPATAHGRSTRATGLTIGDLVGTIGAQNWKFGDMSIAAGAPVYLLANAQNNIVKMDKTVYSVISNSTAGAQTFVFDTKDISSINDVDPLIKDKYGVSSYKQEDTRWLKFRAEIMGAGSVSALYSTDAGINWDAFPEGAKTIDNTWKMYTWDVDVAASQFRVRLTNTAQNEAVHVRYERVVFIPGADIV